MEIAHFSVFPGQKHDFLTLLFGMRPKPKIGHFAQPVPILCLYRTKWNEYVQ